MCVCLCVWVLVGMFDAETIEPCVFVFVCAPGSLWCLKGLGAHSDRFVCLNDNDACTCHSPLNMLTIASRTERWSCFRLFLFICHGNIAQVLLQVASVTPSVPAHEQRGSQASPWIHFFNIWTFKVIIKKTNSSQILKRVQLLATTEG